MIAITIAEIKPSILKEMELKALHFYTNLKLNLKNV